MRIGCELVNGGINFGIPDAGWLNGKGVEYITGNVTRGV